MSCLIALAIAAMIASGTSAVKLTDVLYEGAITRTGVASTYGPGWDGWLAVPEGPGIDVRVCGRGGCVTRVSTDAGPSRAMQRKGRIVDLDTSTFEAVCGVPWTRGLCRVTVSYP